MSGPLLPVVRLMFVCESAEINLADMKWVLTRPWSVVVLPDGVGFPYRQGELWIFAQFSDGAGTFDVRVEMRQLLDDGGRRSVGSGVPTRLDFPRGQRLGVFDMASN